jgi:hypothetical protein
MTFFLNHGLRSSLAALTLGILTIWASEPSINLLHKKVSDYIESPWCYETAHMHAPWFDTHTCKVPDAIISFSELAKTLAETDHSLESALADTTRWGETDRTVFYLQKQFIPAGSSIAVFGDIHGSIHSLLRSLLYLVELGYVNDNFTFKDPHFYMVFLGDYVDRGAFSPEVLYVVMKLKAVNSEKVFLIRGNHETEDAGISPTSWREDLGKRYGFDGPALIAQFTKFFLDLPLAVYLGIEGPSKKDFILFSHAGVDVNFDIHDFLAATEPLPTYHNVGTRTLYNWADIGKKAEAGGSRHHGRPILDSAEIAKWLSGTNHDGICVHCIIRGHQHSDNALLDDGQGYTASDNVHTLFSGPGATRLPYDSFLLIKTAPTFAGWRGTHIFRKVGLSAKEIRSWQGSLSTRAQKLKIPAATLAKINEATPDVKKEVVERLKKSGATIPEGESSLAIAAKAWDARSIILSTIPC